MRGAVQVRYILSDGGETGGGDVTIGEHFLFTQMDVLVRFNNNQYGWKQISRFWRQSLCYATSLSRNNSTNWIFVSVQVKFVSSCINTVRLRSWREKERVYLHNKLTCEMKENTNKWKSAQRRRKHCALAVVRPSQKISPTTDPFPGARDGQNLIRWRWSIPLPTNPVWWGSMHAPTHPQTNRQTNKQANKQDRLQCTAPLLARSVKREADRKKAQTIFLATYSW